VPPGVRLVYLADRMMFSVHALARRVAERTLFADLSFELETGERLVVRGASGSGKTCLLRALAGLDPIADGRVELDGRTLEAWGAEAWRAEITWVPQRPAVLPGTPADFLARVESLAVQRRRAADDPRALAARWSLPPEAWMRPWSVLSGGERQRVSLAIAVSRRPAVLLLDEPTAALDPAATAAVETDLAGRTAVWVTHDDAQAARVGGRVLDMSS